MFQYITKLQTQSSIVQTKMIKFNNTNQNDKVQHNPLDTVVQIQHKRNNLN